MVLFPEGGFLCKRRETSQKYAKKNNLPILENVTLPRVGAMQTIFDTLGPALSRNMQDQQLNSRPSKTAFGIKNCLVFKIYLFIVYENFTHCKIVMIVI